MIRGTFNTGYLILSLKGKIWGEVVLTQEKEHRQKKVRERRGGRLT